jgi:transposase
MTLAVRLREDYDARHLRALAKASRDANQTRRLLALAAIYDGGSRGEAARIGGVGIQTVRDWVLAFNAAGPEGLIDGKAPGRVPLLNAEQRAALPRIVEAGPNPAVDGWCAGGWSIWRSGSISALSHLVRCVCWQYSVLLRNIMNHQGDRRVSQTSLVGQKPPVRRPLST